MTETTLPPGAVAEAYAQVDGAPLTDAELAELESKALELANFSADAGDWDDEECESAIEIARDLPRLLSEVRRAREVRADKDAAYLERNRVVAALASVFPSGIARTDILGWLPEWHGCVYIDLPTGQASWHYHDSHAHLFAHLPPYAGKWDGHTTAEKYERLRALTGGTNG